MTSARLGKMLACGVPYPLLGAARRTVAYGGTVAYMARITRGVGAPVLRLILRTYMSMTYAYPRRLSC